MKTALLTISVLTLLMACRREEPAKAVPATDTAPKIRKAWHCPMHPQIVREAPGKCPICGMELVPMESSSTSVEPGQPAPTAGPEVAVPSSMLQKIGVRTARAEAGALGNELRLDAEGVLDEASELSVTVRTMGYLEAVEAPRSGEAVRQGQILAKFYSPDLVAAQGEWLAATARHDSLGARAARERLETYGVTESVLEAARKQAHPVRAIPLLSPASGWLVQRSAVAGQAVMAGAEVFRIARGSGALLEAHLPQTNLDGVRPGLAAEVSGPGVATASARVLALLPQFDRSSRTATVRLGTAARIRPGALYQVTLRPGSATGTLIPESAVLHSGRRDVVFLALGGGRFRPVVVTLGAITGGKALVREGLEPGQDVVVSAQFLLDGESRLQAALEAMNAGKSTP